MKNLLKKEKSLDQEVKIILKTNKHIIIAIKKKNNYKNHYPNIILFL